MIGKPEKGFKFLPIASNRRLHLQSPMLSKLNSRQLLGELIRLGCASRYDLEIIGGTKHTTDYQTTTHIKIASEHTKTYVLKDPLIFNNNRIIVSITPHPSTPTATAGVAVTAMLIVKNILLQYSQIQVTLALHRLLGAENILIVMEITIQLGGMKD